MADPLPDTALAVECRMTTIRKPMCFSVMQRGNVAGILTREQLVAALNEFDEIEAEYESWLPKNQKIQPGDPVLRPSPFRGHNGREPILIGRKSDEI